MHNYQFKTRVKTEHAKNIIMRKLVYINLLLLIIGISNIKAQENFYPKKEYSLEEDEQFEYINRILFNDNNYVYLLRRNKIDNVYNIIETRNLSDFSASSKTTLPIKIKTDIAKLSFIRVIPSGIHLFGIYANKEAKGEIWIQKFSRNGKEMGKPIKRYTIQGLEYNIFYDQITTNESKNKFVIPFLTSSYKAKKPVISFITLDSTGTIIANTDINLRLKDEENYDIGNQHPEINTDEITIPNEDNPLLFKLADDGTVYGYCKTIIKNDNSNKDDYTLRIFIYNSKSDSSFVHKINTDSLHLNHSYVSYNKDKIVFSSIYCDKYALQQRGTNGNMNAKSFDKRYTNGKYKIGMVEGLLIADFSVDGKLLGEKKITTNQKWFKEEQDNMIRNEKQYTNFHFTYIHDIKFKPTGELLILLQNYHLENVTSAGVATNVSLGPGNGVSFGGPLYLAGTNGSTFTNPNKYRVFVKDIVILNIDTLLKISSSTFIINKQDEINSSNNFPNSYLSFKTIEIGTGYGLLMNYNTKNLLSEFDLYNKQYFSKLDPTVRNNSLVLIKLNEKGEYIERKKLIDYSEKKYNAWYNVFNLEKDRTLNDNYLLFSTSEEYNAFGILSTK